MTWTGGSRTYSPKSKTPFKVSRSKIDLFLECPRCFYFDRRLGIGRPSMPGFSLNTAVDVLLKKEFDVCRTQGKKHELMKRYGVDAVPFVHEELSAWRENFVGKQVLHAPTNFVVFGAVDDIWVNPNNELIIVDYKSTSTEKEISLDDQWKTGYKKQLEMYQWIFKESGFAVSPTSYIVYANAIKQKDQFDGKLEFVMTLHAHIGDTRWIEPVLFLMKACLDNDALPPVNDACEYCMYRKKIGMHETIEGQLLL